jgi:putative SOS response-associated peptidase YedK
MAVLMCGKYSLRKDPSEYLRHAFPGIQFDASFEFQPIENVCPASDMPVLLNAKETPFLTLLRWGLIPSWSKEEKPGTGIINARSETVGSKPSFKASFRRKRCVVPIDSYYEWKKKENVKTPYRFFKQDEPHLLLAGLWDEWERPAGLLRTFCVLTTEANSSVADVHDRMPVVLTVNRAHEWLATNEDTSKFSSFFEPSKLPSMDREEIESTKLAVRSLNPDHFLFIY